MGETVNGKEIITDGKTYRCKPSPPAISQIQSSDWKCYLFGMGEYGVTFTPIKGKEPNAFWRVMQYLCFGNEWINIKEEKDD